MKEITITPDKMNEIFNNNGNEFSGYTENESGWVDFRFVKSVISGSTEYLFSSAGTKTKSFKNLGNGLKHLNKFLNENNFQDEIENLLN